MVIMIHCKYSMPATPMTQFSVVNLAEPVIVMDARYYCSCFSKDVLLHMCLHPLHFGIETDLVAHDTHTGGCCSCL